ncbi:MAG: hypothetical protein JWQ72_3081 [Polaromonas sp.]|nr:hypothetical protein [Polaromonas sp.]
MVEAVAALQLAETQSLKVAERDGIALAWRQLLEHKTRWGPGYQAGLLAAFAATSQQVSEARKSAGVAEPRPGFDRAESVSLRMALESFSLVDDREVTQAIESSRLLQHLLPVLEQSLAELDTLISSAQGLANVRPELNPLRPEAFTRTLQDLMAAAGPDPSTMALWTRYLADPLGRELRALYSAAVAQLESAHVQAASYRVLQTPASQSARARAPSGAGKGGGNAGGGQGGQTAGPASGEPVKVPSQYADLSNYEIRDELFQDFLFHGGSNAHHGLAPSYYATVEEELVALQEAPDSSAVPLPEAQAERAAYEAVPAVDRPQRFVDVSSPLSAKVWGTYGRSRERAIVRTQLRKEATRVGQVLGLEVVRKLVNQVAQDPRLLVPVREAIVALEPSLLRLAMVDPRFFSDEGHPGRRLMERVAQRSFKYNDEYSSDFGEFFQPVSSVFNELNGLAITDARPFGMALARLEHGWDEQDQIEFEGRQKVLKALHFAEERQEQADQIAFDLSTRADLDNVPGVVLDFLFGPWALAMAHAKLSDQRHQVDPEGFGSVVPDLLWSVKRDVTLKRPAKLIEMIPGLLEKLHSGLALLGQSPQENQKVFESLMKLHQPVLKLRRLKSKRDAEESGVAPLEPEDLPATPEQRRARAAEQPWLGRDDLDAAGFEDTLPTAPGELGTMEGPAAAAKDAVGEEHAVAGAGAAEPAPDGNTAAQEVRGAPSATVVAMGGPEAEAILLGFRTGSWVDLYSKRRWLRAQLIWASAKGTLFMFLSHGGQPHSMTKRSCEKLIMQRLLRPVDTHAVVGQALDAVASALASPVPAEVESDGQPSRYDEPATV